MRTYFAVLIVSALAAFLLTPVARWLAYRWGAVDHPEPRKVHQKPTPRLGGLAVFGGFCFPWVTLYFFDNLVTATFQNYEKLFLILLLGGLAMVVLGIYDDIKGANAWKKFTVQTLVALGLYWGGYQVPVLTNPFGEGSFELGPASLPVTVLWIVGVTNAINLLDGIDGLVTGVTACIALALAMINVVGGNTMVALLTLCLAGACLGFLPYNFSPARIFLGDTGSLFLGVTLACIGLFSHYKGTMATLVAVPLVLFGLPLFDTLRVMIGRWKRRAPLFQADKTHVHHRLLALGLNQKQAAYFLYVICGLLGAISVWLNLQETMVGEMTVAAAFVLLAVLVWLVVRTRMRHGGKVE